MTLPTEELPYPKWLEQLPRQRVGIKQRRGYVELVFIDPCLYCGRKHTHGASSPKTYHGQPGTQENYGPREPHCGDHTHLLAPSGKRRRLSYTKGGLQVRCLQEHDSYLLVPS